MEEDLEQMSRQQLIREIKKQGCLRYRQSLDEQVFDASRTKESYGELIGRAWLWL